MITRIYVDNYKCFSNFVFEPKRMNLLVGDNGSGKTGLMEVLAGLRALVRSTVVPSDYFPSTSTTRWDRRTEQRFELRYEHREFGTFDWTVVVDRENAASASRIVQESVVLAGQRVAERDLPKRKVALRGSDVPIPYEFAGSLLSLDLDDAALRALRDRIFSTGFLKMDLREIEPTTVASSSLRFDGRNFASAYRALREGDFEATQRLHEELRKVIPRFRSFELEDIPGGAKRLVLSMSAAAGKTIYALGLDELSDGQRALVVLYHALTDMDRWAPSMFFDEPDNFVSLRELQPWLQKLSLAVENEEGAQAFIISHNPEVIDYLAADSAWLFEREDGGPVRSPRPLPIDRDSGLKASEQLARGWIRGA